MDETRNPQQPAPEPPNGDQSHDAQRAETSHAPPQAPAADGAVASGNPAGDTQQIPAAQDDQPVHLGDQPAQPSDAPAGYTSPFASPAGPEPYNPPASQHSAPPAQPASPYSAPPASHSAPPVSPYSAPTPTYGEPFSYPQPGDSAYQRPADQPYRGGPNESAQQHNTGAIPTYPPATPQFGSPGYGAPNQGTPNQGAHHAPQQGAHSQGAHTGTQTFGALGYGPPAPPKSNRGKLAAGIAVGAIAIALISGVTGAAATVALSDDNGNSSAPVITREVSPTSTKASAAGTVEAAAAAINPSVVTLQVEGTSGGRESQGTGSGVIIREDGYILTNNHVAAPASNSGTIRVFFSDGTSKPAKIVGLDASNDLAVVKVDGVKGLKAATFADSSSVKIGQSVIAVGAPLGLSGTVTEGIVSAVNRPVRTGDGTGQDAVIDAVQTDAAINPGNSGGPLVDMSGRVVGINSAIATVGGNSGGLPGQSSQSGNIGVGFAIPADDAVQIAGQLIADGKAEHATLGVSAQDSPDGAGAVVASVVSGSPADKAGLKAQDVVTAINDRRIVDVDSLVAAVRDYKSGDKVSVTYTRGGKSTKVDATLTSS